MLINNTIAAIISVLVELLILRHYLYILLEPKISDWQLSGIYIMAAVVLVIMSITEVAPYFRTALYFIIMAAVILSSCRGSFFWRILIAVCFTYFMAGVEIHAYFLLLFVQAPASVIYVCGVLLSKLMSVVAIQYLARMLTRTYYYVSKTEQSMILLMPAGTILTMYVILEMSLLASNKLMYLLATVCASILMGGMQVALYLFNKQLDREQLQKQIDIQKSVLTNKTEYEKKMGVIRQMGHDLKNILTVLAAYIKERQCEEALEYISAKGIQLENNKVTYTNNELLNSLIADKTLLARERQLDIKVINAVNTYAISIDDLMLILAEGLDNAVENACIGSTIEVVIEQKGNFMQLAICNCIDEKVAISGGRIKTRKADQERHGLGINGIRTLVHKYDGDLQFISSDSQFTCLILVPYASGGLNFAN